MPHGSQKIKQPIVTFTHVMTEPDPVYDSPLWDVSFNLCRGELLLIRLERGHYRLPLADVAAGILQPSNGKVFFLKKDWQTMSPDQSSTFRGKIGRLFADHGWLSHLDIENNIALAQQHHSNRKDKEIFEEATMLARFFGLPGLPKGPVSQLRKEDLEVALFVRAFLGRPDLIILEQPTKNLFPAILPPLINAIRTARDHGTAILWTTSDPLVWQDAGIKATMKYMMFGARMSVAQEENS